jgi:hypothetical protein
MPIEIILESQNKGEYLLITSKGTLNTKEELVTHSQMVFDEIIKHGATHVLVNNVKTHFPVELFPYFGLVKGYAEDYPPEIRALQIAVVTAPEYKEVAASWETLCQSRGLHFYAFTSLEDARAWLLEKE